MMNLREKAYAFALDEHSLPHYCSGCVKAETALGGADEDGAVVRKLSRCSSCRSVYYCSAECQRADWPLHKAECKCIRRAGSGVGDESLRLVLRIHSKSKRKQQTNNDEPGAVKNGTTPISPFNRTLDDLIGHVAALTSTKEYQSWASNFRAFARGEAPPGGDAKTSSPAMVTIEETRLKKLYAKVCVNSFGLTNEASHKIGLALHLALSAIDHSCAPKARIAYVGDVAVMVPTRKSDTPLSIERAQHSYINEMLGREERRRLLKEKYNFHCRCEACEDDERERELSGYACEHCSAGCVDTAGGLCNSCSTRMSQELVDLCELNNRMVESALSSIASAPNTPSEKQLLICVKLLELMEGVYHKYNVKQFAVLRSAMQCALALRKVDETVGYSQRLVDFQQHYQQEQDLSLLHARLNLAKLLMLQGKRKEARGVLEEVAPTFKAIYGEASEISTNIQLLLLGLTELESCGKT